MRNVQYRHGASEDIQLYSRGDLFRARIEQLPVLLVVVGNELSIPRLVQSFFLIRQSLASSAGRTLHACSGYRGNTRRCSESSADDGGLYSLIYGRTDIWDESGTEWNDEVTLAEILQPGMLGIEEF